MREGTCINCYFSDTDPEGKSAELVCFRHPPKVVMMMQIHPVTQQPTQIPGSIFPPVSPNLWCGEYSKGKQKSLPSAPTASPIKPVRG